MPENHNSGTANPYRARQSMAVLVDKSNGWSPSRTVISPFSFENKLNFLGLPATLCYIFLSCFSLAYPSERETPYNIKKTVKFERGIMRNNQDTKHSCGNFCLQRLLQSKTLVYRLVNKNPLPGFRGMLRLRHIQMLVKI